MARKAAFMQKWTEFFLRDIGSRRILAALLVAAGPAAAVVSAYFGNLSAPLILACTPLSVYGSLLLLKSLDLEYPEDRIRS